MDLTYIGRINTSFDYYYNVYVNPKNKFKIKKYWPKDGEPRETVYHPDYMKSMPEKKYYYNHSLLKEVYFENSHQVIGLPTYSPVPIVMEKKLMKAVTPYRGYIKKAVKDRIIKDILDKGDYKFGQSDPWH